MQKKSFLPHWAFVVSTGLWFCMSNFQLTALKNKTDDISRKDDRGRTSPVLVNFKGKSSYTCLIKCPSHSVSLKDEEGNNLNLTLHNIVTLWNGKRHFRIDDF